MKFVKPKLFDGPSLSIGQDHGPANKVGSSFVQFGKDCTRSRFGCWHDVALVGYKGAGVANESVQLVASARQ